MALLLGGLEPVLLEAAWLRYCLSFAMPLGGLELELLFLELINR